MKQLYRVKLNEGHTAKPDQIAVGYLGDYSTTDPALYTKGEAQKKAKMFGGSVEPFGRSYHLNELKMVQIPNEQLSERLLNELKDRESFADVDTDLNEKIYSADIFEAILGEVDEAIEQELLVRVGKKTQDLIDELLVLIELTKDYEYVMITSY
jgi:hypothetical protein